MGNRGGAHLRQVALLRSLERDLSWSGIVWGPKLAPIDAGGPARRIGWLSGGDVADARGTFGGAQATRRRDLDRTADIARSSHAILSVDNGWGRSHAGARRLEQCRGREGPGADRQLRTIDNDTDPLGCIERICSIRRAWRNADQRPPGFRDKRVERICQHEFGGRRRGVDHPFWIMPSG